MERNGGGPSGDSNNGQAEDFTIPDERGRVVLTLSAQFDLGQLTLSDRTYDVRCSTPMTITQTAGRIEFGQSSRTAGAWFPIDTPWTCAGTSRSERCAGESDEFVSELETTARSEFRIECSF